MKNTNRQHRFLFLLISIVAGVVIAPAYAQDKPSEVDKTSEIDQIFSWATLATPGGAVAVSINGKVIVSRAYGLADLERDVPVTPDTIFDAASVTKQFVAAAILLLVEEGRLSLSEDIRKYVPELPETGHRITLDHLMTHTSGIRDWTGILPLAAGDPDALTMVLRQRALNFAPGEELSYSNSGYVLLKEIVARTSGTSFSEFALNRLFEPLGMKSTQYLGDLREIVKNRALAYEKDQRSWKLEMKLDNDRGGGGALLSTPSDLLIWNEALTSGRLGEFVTQKLHEPAKLNNGRILGYGRGLCLDSYRGAKEVWHSGGSAGYATWLGRYPEHGLSIAIMCNAGDLSEPSRLAHRIFDLYVPGAGDPDPEDGPPPAIPDDALDEAKAKTGLFVDEQTGDLLRLVLDRGRFRVAGGPGLVPVTKDRFRRWGATVQFMSQDEFELHFLSADRFEMKSMEGVTTRYRRARAYAPTSDELKVFAGHYESDEIGATFRIAPQEGGLLICLDHAPEKCLEFKPVDDDTFQLSRVAVRFLRDDSGKVVALEYTNPVVRRVKFTRVSDRS